MYFKDKEKILKAYSKVDDKNFYCNGIVPRGNVFIYNIDFIKKNEIDVDEVIKAQKKDVAKSLGFFQIPDQNKIISLKAQTSVPIFKASKENITRAIINPPRSPIRLLEENVERQGNGYCKELNRELIISRAKLERVTAEVKKSQEKFEKIKKATKIERERAKLQLERKVRQGRSKILLVPGRESIDLFEHLVHHLCRITFFGWSPYIKPETVEKDLQLAVLDEQWTNYEGPW